MILIDAKIARSLRDYDETTTKLRQLTGYDVHELVRLFAAGYNLVPPDPPSYTEMRDLAKEME